MHAVFCVGQVQQGKNDNRTFQVNLTLTGDNDPELKILTGTMKQEIARDTGWHPLGSLLGEVTEFEEVEQIFDKMLNQKMTETQKRTFVMNLDGSNINKIADENL